MLINLKDTETGFIFDKKIKASSPFFPPKGTKIIVDKNIYYLIEIEIDIDKDNITFIVKKT